VARSPEYGSNISKRWWQYLLNMVVISPKDGGKIDLLNMVVISPEDGGNIS